MKKLCKAALCFLPFVCLLVCVNWYADPANVLRGDYEQKVAAILASGENATNLRNMDDRTFMKTYANLRTQPIDTLVLGSSHAMQITKELTGDENTFCAGVTGADLRDCISIYELFKSKNFAPKRVIIAVDSWFLSEGTLEKRAMTDGYTAFCKQQGFAPLKSSKLELWLQAAEKKGQAFSIPYFQTSLDYIKRGLIADRNAVPTQDFYTVTDMRRADGSYCYNEKLRTILPEETAARAANVIVAKPEFARNFNGVSEPLLRQLEAFVRSLQADGVQVALMLAPFHPDYYDYMCTQTDSYVPLLGTQTLVSELAKKLDVPLFGSYNPYDCGLTAIDFYDGIHCTDTAMTQFYPENLFG
ncbi:MAG: hypothetical protein RSC73_02715 [Ruthenibacterium sp.]